MKKKALHKDIRQEIKKTFPRFLSLFLMSALGVSFFSGVRASMPDMLSTTDKYMKEANMFDLQVISTMGLQEEDLEAVLKTEGVEDAELSYSADLLCDKEGEQYVVHLMAESSMAQAKVEEGRLPKKADEIFLDSELASTLECKIGDKVTFYEERKDEETEPVLKKDVYTVVGTGSSPLYLSMGRGNASIGNGQVTGFAVVSPEAFNMDVYTQMNLKLEGAKELECYSKEYKELVENVQAVVEETAKGQCEWRYHQIYDEAEEELLKAEAELAEGKETAQKELSNGRKELDDGWVKILDGEKQLQDGKKKIADSEAQILENEQSLKDARNQLAAAKQKAEAGAAQISEGKVQTGLEEEKLYAARQQLAQGKEELAKAKEEAEKKLEAGRQQLEEKKRQLEESQKYLEGLKAQLTQTESDLTRKQTELSELESHLMQEQQALEQIQSQIAELEEQLGEPGDPQYDEIYAKIQELKVEEARQAVAVQDISASIEKRRGEIQGLEAGIAEMQGTIGSLEIEIPEAEAALEAGYAAFAEQESRVQQEFQIREQEISNSEAQLAAGEEKLQSAKAALDAALADLNGGNAQIASYESQIASGEDQLAAGKEQLAQAKAELPAQEKKLEDFRKELEDGEKEYEQERKDTEKELADGETQITDAREELERLEQPKWYVNSREEALEDYGEMEDNAKQIGAIGKVFPLIFFLVAALVSLTTMTRMVEEQRGHIGTMKALGYRKADIAMKYLWYAGSATLGGGVAGILIGQKLFPYVIQISYGIMYDCLRSPELPYRFASAFQALGISVICIMAATTFSCMKELRELPAELMRPEAPKAGKRVLLEYIPFIWKHLNFTTKSTFRNIFRYKKRLFMTIFGISATMGLLVTGFGLRDSIIDLAEIQYDNIQLYDAMVTLNGTEQEKNELKKWLNDNDEVQASTMVHMEMPDVKTSEGSGEIYLCVPENIKDFETMTILKNRISGKVYTLDDEGVLLTEWISDTLGVSAGDTITLQKEDGDSVEVRVSGVVENYIMNYAYMSPVLYESIYNEPAEYEVMYVELTEQGREHEKEIGAEILQNPGVYNVSYTTDTQNEINDMLQALVLVIIVLIITAALLAYVVLYNLNNVNITERRRELATLKVLGFYDKEVAAYVYHENIILTFIGIIVGAFLGTLLHQYIIHTIRVDMVMFGQRVSLISFLISAVLTGLFSAFVNFVMYFKLKEIDMVESLKSVE